MDGAGLGTDNIDSIRKRFLRQNKVTICNWNKIVSYLLWDYLEHLGKIEKSSTY